jgi:hypothetical protein
VKLYEREKGDYNIVIGNSFGAVVALITAAKIRPDEVILCSLSPFFQEDIGPGWPTKTNTRRLDISSYSVTQLAAAAQKLSTEFVVMYGEQEVTPLPRLVARVRDTAQALGVDAKEAPGAPHSFRDEAYVQAIMGQL